MSHSWDYDAIVIGSGPGGEGAAMGLVKQGARVAVIERYHNVGGGCTHWGTIPSKALRHAVSRIIEFNQNPLYSDHSRLLRSSFADYLELENHMPRAFTEAQAEAMVTIVFSAGAEALDVGPEQRRQLEERLVLQLRMISKGAYYWYRREQEKMSHHSE